MWLVPLGFGVASIRRNSHGWTFNDVAPGVECLLISDSPASGRRAWWLPLLQDCVERGPFRFVVAVTGSGGSSAKVALDRAEVRVGNLPPVPMPVRTARGDADGDGLYSLPTHFDLMEQGIDLPDGVGVSVAITLRVKTSAGPEVRVLSHELGFETRSTICVCGIPLTNAP